MERPSPSCKASPRRRCALIAITVAISAAISGCGTSAGSTTEAPASVAPPAACSASAPASLPTERWRAARHLLAPPGAGAIRLCRYSGLNAHLRLALVRSRLLDRRTIVRQLVTEFDRLPSMREGVHCPKDDGSQILALLAYPGGREVSISVGLTGCALVTSGSVHRTAAGLGTPRAFGPQLLASLTQLVNVAQESKAGTANTLAHGRWSVLPRSPLGTRYRSTFLWDGRELLELGGSSGGRLGGAPSDSSAAYNLATRRWRRLASAPSALLPDNAASTWTGHQAFIFGGPSLPTETATNLAGLYDPATNHWTVTSKAPVGPFNAPTAVWTGTRVILAGMTRGTPRLQVASYDPITNTWTSLPPPISPRHPTITMAMVATNNGVLLWSLWGQTKRTGSNTYTSYSGVDVYRLTSSGAWANVTDAWPQRHTVDQPVFTGSKILLAPGQIWCGACSHPAPFDEHGYIVDPATLHRTAIPHGPLDDIGPQIVWTGRAEISFNTAGEITGPDIRVLPGDIAIWNPTTRKWTRGPRAPKAIGDAPAVWNGTHLFVLAQTGTILSYGNPAAGG